MVLFIYLFIENAMLNTVDDVILAIYANVEPFISDDCAIFWSAPPHHHSTRTEMSKDAAHSSPCVNICMNIAVNTAAFNIYIWGTDV